MINDSSALAISGLSYSYRSQWLLGSVQALNKITLEVKSNEAFGFLGHNGAGKTTTIKCILNLIKPSCGEIQIFGKPYFQTQARRLIGYLPEQPYFYDHLSVLELMQLYACLAGVEKSKRQDAISWALSRLGIEDRADSKMRSLSKGLTQRVAMAQAIVAKPRLLILDEPFSGLDPIGRKEFRDLILELKNDGTTIFMSSHVLSDVEYICDRVSITVKGELRGIFEIKELSSAKASQFNIRLENFKDCAESMVKAAAEHSYQAQALNLTFRTQIEAQTALKLALEKGAKIVNFQAIHPSLEELFVQIVSQGK